MTFKSDVGGVNGPAAMAASSQVVAMAAAGFSFDDLSAWVTPVVNAGTNNIHIAWSSPQGIGVLGKRAYTTNNVTTYPQFPLADRQQLSVRRLLTNYDEDAPNYASPLRGARYPTLNPLSNASKGHDDASLLWQEDGQILYARPRLRRQAQNSDSDAEDNLGFDDYSTAGLCYQLSGGDGNWACAAEFGGNLMEAVATNDALITYVSNATNGLATMPSVARSLDRHVEGKPMRIGLDNALAAGGAHRYFETESITYQVLRLGLEPPGTSRSEIIRRHFIEVRETPVRDPGATPVPMLLHWWRSRTFSESASLFHSHIVPGVHRVEDKFDIPYGFRWENSAPIWPPVSMRLRDANRSDSAVWNAYSLIEPSRYNTMWSAANVSETPASIWAKADHDETSVDVIPNNVFVVMHPLGLADPIHTHSPSVHLNGAWPHVSTASSTTPASTRHHTMAFVEVLKNHGDPPVEHRTIFTSVEPFYKPRPDARSDRRHIGLELGSGHLGFHIVADGREVPVSWMPMGTTQRPGDKLVLPTFEVASAPIAIHSHKAIDVTLDGGLRSEIELYLDAVDGNGDVLASTEVPLEMIPVMPEVLTKVTMLAVNGKGGNYRFRAVTRDAQTAIMSESIERFFDARESTTFEGKAKEHHEVVTIDLASATSKTAARRISGIAELTVIPNPTTDHCIIIVPAGDDPMKPAMGSLTVVDATGAVVAFVRAIEGTVISLDTHMLSAGVFSISYITDGIHKVLLRQRMIVVR